MSLRHRRKHFSEDTNGASHSKKRTSIFSISESVETVYQKSKKKRRSESIRKKKRKNSNTSSSNTFGEGTIFEREENLKASKKKRRSLVTSSKKKRQKSVEYGKRRLSKIDQMQNVREGFLRVIMNEVDEQGFRLIQPKKIYYVISTSFGRQEYKSKIYKRNQEQLFERVYEFCADNLAGDLIIRMYAIKKSENVLIGEAHLSLSRLADDVYHELVAEMKFIHEPINEKIEMDPFFRYSIKLLLFHRGAEASESSLQGDGRFDDHYKLCDKIGEGGFASIYKAYHRKTKTYYAVKLFDLKNETSSMEDIYKEIEIMRKLKSDYLIQFKETFLNERNLHLVLELAEDGELYDFLAEHGRFNESEAKIIMRQLIKAVAYLHQNGIAHRDLKLENILVISKEKMIFKVADFGLSKDYSNEALRTACGTPDYVAPEILQGNPYDNSVDVWSLGVLCYMLLSGNPPFYGERQQIFSKILSGKFEFYAPVWRTISDEAKEFIETLLSFDPESRPCAEDCLLAPWLNSP